MTVYVIFNEKTLYRVTSSTGHNSWRQKGTARRTMESWLSRHKDVRDPENYKVDTLENYYAADHEIEVTSAFDGKTKCKIMRSAKGGPTDPSMEGYWQN